MQIQKLFLMKPPSGTLNLDDVRYPCYGSIKYDGFRVGIREGRTYLNSLREVDNLHTRNLLMQHADVLDGFDGELTVGDLHDPECFNNCQSAFSRASGEPDFTFWVFDRIAEGTYEERTHELRRMTDSYNLPAFVKVVKQMLITNRTQLNAFIDWAISAGHEGVMLRRPDGQYLFKRATFKTQELLRIKPMETDEAVIEDFEHEVENTNPRVENAQGKVKRSAAQAGLVPKDTLGVLVCRHAKFGLIRLNGFTDEFADEVWRNKEKYRGQLATFSYQKHGTTDKPRLLKFKGIRSPKDMSK